MRHEASLKRTIYFTWTFTAVEDNHIYRNIPFAQISREFLFNNACSKTHLALYLEMSSVTRCTSRKKAIQYDWMQDIGCEKKWGCGEQSYKLSIMPHEGRNRESRKHTLSLSCFYKAAHKNTISHAELPRRIAGHSPIQAKLAEVKTHIMPRPDRLCLRNHATRGVSLCRGNRKRERTIMHPIQQSLFSLFIF